MVQHARGITHGSDSKPYALRDEIGMRHRSWICRNRTELLAIVGLGDKLSMRCRIVVAERWRIAQMTYLITITLPQRISGPDLLARVYPEFKNSSFTPG